MNDFQLKCFLAVADSLSFARAADNLNVSQPAITHQIQSLENELGSQLFTRTTRIVRLTKAGEFFIPEAKQIVRISEQARHRFEKMGGLDFPSLRIACHGPLELTFMPEILQALSFKHPGLHPEITTANFSYLYRTLEENEADLVLSFNEINKDRIPGTYKELLSINVVALCRPDHPLAGSGSICFDDVVNEPLVLLDPKNSPSELSPHFLHMLNRHPAETLHLCTNPETCSILSKAGYGVTILPENLVPVGTDLVRIPVTDLPELSFGIYYRPGNTNPVLKDFLKLASGEKNFSAYIEA